MKNLQLIIFFILYSLAAQSQILWLESKEDGQLIDHVDKDIVHENKGNNAIINHHDAVRMEQPILNAQKIEGNGCTVFTVWTEEPTIYEELIWKIHDNHGDKILSTNKRIANLENQNFINFHQNKSALKLSTYYTHLHTTENTFLSLASAPQNDQIPVGIFGGALAEMIVFDKVLSPQSIQLIQGILSLKYSLPLPVSHTYLSLANEIIWDNEDDYYSNIAGIGMLKELHFNQNISSNAFDQGELTISTEEEITSNNSFLLWADDGELVAFNPKNGIEILERQWKLKKIRWEDKALSLKINSKVLNDYLEEGHHYYWVVSDDEDKHIYTLNQNQQTFTANFNFEGTSATAELIMAPDFWSLVDIEGLQCSEELSGSLDGTIVAGNGPFTITLSHSTEETIEQRTDNRKFSFDLHAPGTYHIEIRDIYDNTWKQSVNATYSDFPSPNIRENYFKDDNGLTIRPFDKEQEDFSISWLDANGETHFSNELKISEAGNYTLIIQKEECINEYPFEVKKQDSAIKSSKVYPNPAASVAQYFEATLERAQPYTISITTQDGRSVLNYDYPASQFIYHPMNMKPGIYMISLHVGDETKTHKLIVLNH